MSSRQLKTLMIVALVSLVAGCKIAAIVVEGGEVSSPGLGPCAEGTICIYEINDHTFNETFTADPNIGWDFVRWNSGGNFFCEGSVSTTCTVSNVGTAGVPSIAAIVDSDATFYIMPIFERAVPEYAIEASDLFFVDGIVSELWVFVAPEWLETDIVSIAIEITGINGGFHEHGTQEALVSSATLLIIDEGEALVSVAWNSDEIITHSPETYTVCVQALIDGQPFNSDNCMAFGPY